MEMKQTNGPRLYDRHDACTGNESWVLRLLQISHKNLRNLKTCYFSWHSYYFFTNGRRPTGPRARSGGGRPGAAISASRCAAADMHGARTRPLVIKPRERRFGNKKKHKKSRQSKPDPQPELLGHCGQTLQFFLSNISLAQGNQFIITTPHLDEVGSLFRTLVCQYLR